MAITLIGLLESTMIASDSKIITQINETETRKSVLKLVCPLLQRLCLILIIEILLKFIMIFLYIFDKYPNNLYLMRRNCVSIIHASYAESPQMRPENLD